MGDLELQKMGKEGYYASNGGRPDVLREEHGGEQ